MRCCKPKCVGIISKFKQEKKARRQSEVVYLKQSYMGNRLVQFQKIS